MDSAHKSILSRSEGFYLDDVIFLVEGQLFKTYAYYFMQHSPMLKLKIEEARTSLSGANALLGSDDEHPIPLDNVTKFEFERFLSTIYPLDPIQDPIRRLSADWGNIPKLAKKLGMNSVCEQCIEILKPMLAGMTPVNKFVIARQFAVDSWFCSAISELITRDATLTIDDGKQLRLDVAFRILRFRGEWKQLKESDVSNVAKKMIQNLGSNRSFYANSHGYYTPSLPTLPHIPAERFSQLDLAIHQCFSSELAEMGVNVNKNHQLQLFRQCLDGDLLQDIETATSTGALQKPTKLFIRHRVHYHEAIIFKVDDQLFKVHSHYFLKHSPFFREMLQAEAYPEQDCHDGQTDKRPLRLDGITKEHFELFLSVIIPKEFLVNTKLDFDGWKIVLELSTMWRMKSLREHCVKQLSPLPSSVSHLEKVLMARKFMAEEWLVEGYKGFIVTPGVPSNMETDELGAASSIELLRLNVRWLEDANKNEANLVEDIRFVFRAEIQRLQEYDIDSEE